MSADFDFITLWEDYDTVVALESRGVGLENPMMRSIAKRWEILEEIEQVVAHESRAMMERAQVMADAAAEGRTATRFAKKTGKIAGKGAVGATKLAGKGAGKAAKATGKGVGKVSAALGVKFKEWAAHYGPKFKEKMDDLLGKAQMMDRKRQKLDRRLDETKELREEPIRGLGWISKVCLLDDVNLDACLWLADHTGDLNGMVKAYTVKVRQYEGLLVGRYKEEADGTLSKIKLGSNAAIHRASGLLGRFTQNDVKARPLAGNVIIVTRGKGEKERVDFATAVESQFGGKVYPLKREQCKKALNAVGKLAKALDERGAKRGVFSYTGIYHEMEAMRADMENKDGEELRAAMLLYKNAMAMEDAFTTAMARTGDGLLNWVAASLKS
ncbi:internal head protein [Erwinia phage vB_EamM_Caitlin]|uniref:internal head protein n=1 Tax=Erwinia phage vB_EamM_Caitlin TaxID=1883379 RepID=UPI00081CC89D|nr:internal head protein [Erwinia phage vB_EamM_Caitlin]ANZ48397.1 hypothetical protein CAITLIN_102 [Erwinia phage vB_EamM_Caitlin]